MQQHSISTHKVPDYEFHMPRSFTHPVPVGILSVVLAGALYPLLRESQPILAMGLAWISILIGLVYLGIFAMLKRITNLERRLQDRDKLLDGIPWQGHLIFSIAMPRTSICDKSAEPNPACSASSR